MGEMVTVQTRKVQDFRGLLDKMKGQLALALPRHIRADRMIRVVLTSVQKTPALLDCTRESLLGAILQASQLGLEPDGLLGHAYLIPYKRNCQLVIGYKGLIKLARQSGELSSLTAVAVFAKDKFEFARGDEEKIVHIPAQLPLVEGKPDLNWDPGPLTHVYAIARLKDGAIQREVMDVGEIEMIRARSKASGDGPWKTDYVEMAKKTVLRRLCKLLPASVEHLEKAVALDEQVDAGLDQTFEPLDIGPVNSEPVAEPKTLDDLVKKNATPATSEDAGL